LYTFSVFADELLAACKNAVRALVLEGSQNGTIHEKLSIRAWFS
jgi:hypothetical protein